MEHDEQPEPAVGDFESMLEWFTGSGQEHRAYYAIEKGDYEKARSLLEPVAARNSAYSLMTLGWLFESGNLGPPDGQTALSYYKRAASQGSAEANQRLGRLLLEQGNEKEAQAAFEHGAESGNISCMFWLGKAMLSGRGGAIDTGLGTEWLERAAAHGHLLAKRALLGLAIRNSDSIFTRSLMWLQIVSLAFHVGKAAWKNPDDDILN
jgi:TPR repeat protein